MSLAHKHLQRAFRISIALLLTDLLTVKEDKSVSTDNDRVRMASCNSLCLQLSQLHDKVFDIILLYRVLINVTDINSQLVTVLLKDLFPPRRL